LECKSTDWNQNVESGAYQGCSGFYNSNTFFNQGNQTSYDLTDGNALFGGDIVLEITVLCASIRNNGAGGTYSLSQRADTGGYESTYCIGNLFQAHNSGLTSTDLMYYNGIKDISGNTWRQGMLTVLGMGDNTS